MIKSVWYCRVILVLCSLTTMAQAFLSSPQASHATAAFTMARRSLAISASDDDDAFSAFADSLQDTETSSSSTATAEKPKPPPPASPSPSSWQVSVDKFLDPTTPIEERQQLVSNILNSNQEIRESVLEALKERKIDPLLTPRSKQLQDGTKAVARQLTTDILPSLNPKKLQSLQPPKRSAQVERWFQSLSNQVARNLETLQDDLKDPTRRIPQRISQQTQSILGEVANIFLETPANLNEPNYTLVESSEAYEIREYQGYTVASTRMVDEGQSFSMDNVASSGAAFNSLAAYLFGANQEEISLDMTTPVATTSVGEMRFYLASSLIPTPKDEHWYESGAVQIVDIPPARLAVRRFTGFCTDGEVARQKDALLTALQLDGVDIDVDHGAVVPHVVFQYNPPYTLPIVRRNEIAVPVRDMASVQNLETAWTDDTETTSQEEDPADDISPSDVE